MDKQMKTFGNKCHLAGYKQPHLEVKVVLMLHLGREQAVNQKEFWTAY